MFAKVLRRKVAVFAALVVGSVGTAQAVPYTWTDSAGDFGHYVSAGSSYQYQHNITDGTFGYRAGVDSISNASLSIWLFDDALFGDIPLFGDREETVGFRFDGGSWTFSQDVDFWDEFDFTVTSLLADGLLNVVVRANSGDFRFGGSYLSAAGDRPTSVPEPTTLTLFGLGLLAMGFSVRLRSAGKS